jgi:hypothetical protein
MVVFLLYGLKRRTAWLGVTTPALREGSATARLMDFWHRADSMTRGRHRQRMSSASGEQQPTTLLSCNEEDVSLRTARSKVVMSDKDVPQQPPTEEQQRSLTGSAAVDAAVLFVNGVATGAGGAVGVHLVQQVFDRPPKEEPPTIELPLGVKRD